MLGSLAIEEGRFNIDGLKENQLRNLIQVSFTPKIFLPQKTLQGELFVFSAIIFPSKTKIPFVISFLFIFNSTLFRLLNSK